MIGLRFENVYVIIKIRSDEGKHVKTHFLAYNIPHIIGRNKKFVWKSADKYTKNTKKTLTLCPIYAIFIGRDLVLRTKITLACTECKQRNYNTTKEKKNHPDRMETKKYCRFCKTHTTHKETK